MAAAPLIISSAPGNAVHFVKELIAPKLFLSELIDSFIPEISPSLSESRREIISSRAYYVNRLVCRNNLEPEQRKLLGIPHKKAIELQQVVFIYNWYDQIPGTQKKIAEPISGILFKSNNQLY